MKILVEFAENDTMFTVAVGKHSKIEELCEFLAQRLGIPSDCHVTLTFEGLSLDPQKTISQVGIPKGGRIIGKKQVVQNTEMAKQIVIVQIPHEEKILTIAVDKQTKINDLCTELAYFLGLEFAHHVTLTFREINLDPSMTFSKAEIPNYGQIIVNKHMGSEIKK